MYTWIRDKHCVFNKEKEKKIYNMLNLSNEWKYLSFIFILQVHKYLEIT